MRSLFTYTQSPDGSWLLVASCHQADPQIMTRLLKTVLADACLHGAEIQKVPTGNMFALLRDMVDGDLCDEK